MRLSGYIGTGFFAALLAGGCASPQRPAAGQVQKTHFDFTSDGKVDRWRSVRLDYVQVAKKFATDRKVAFDFEGAESHLMILQDGNLVFARIMFDKGPGTKVFSLDVDSSGNVIRSYPVHDGD